MLKNPHTGLSQANCDAVLDGMDAMQANFSDNLYHAYLNGATIVCNLVPAFWPAAAREMSSYRGVTGYGWMANLYLTPSAAQGFSMHTDNTDGLVAQLYGSKQWTMHNSTLPLPYREQRVGRREQPGHETVMESQPAFEATINQGDLLLVPRGYVHMARATDDAPSAHLTLSAVKVGSYI